MSDRIPLYSLPGNAEPFDVLLRRAVDRANGVKPEMDPRRALINSNNARIRFEAGLPEEEEG